MDWFAGAVAGREQERCRRGVSDRIVLCYLGGLSSWQCIAETIQLAMRLRREIPEIYFLLLTPDNPQSYRRQLDQIGRDGVDYAVRSVAADEVPVALSAVDAGFLLREDSPVNRVASPTKCGEYLAAGAPVICTRHAGDAAPVVETSGAGIVLGDKLPSDAEMVRLVGFLRDVRGDRQAWQEKAMTAARRYCDWASYEEALRVLYRSYRWPEGFPRLPVARARRHSS
ncbi:MAG: glycosyltransferase family 4 protein [Verrucomicrobia bacterium]|nr:glycosyltransferase family 4 protein [Verrucomicrobiota bacterium]